MKVLITGGAGFIGSTVQDACVTAGYTVGVLDNLSSGNADNLNPKARFYQADITDEAAVKKIFDDFKPDVLCHHAAQIDVRLSVAHPRRDAEINILGSLTLLDAAQQAGVKKVVFASSGGACYGEQQQFPADETHPTHPLSPYGITKLAVEQYLAFSRATSGLNAVALRYANVYGPRQNPHGDAGVVAIFIGRLSAGKPATIYGTGEQTRDYVFVGDVAQANLRAIETTESGAFNIGTGVETSVKGLLEKLSVLADRTPTVCYAEARAGEQLRSVISAEKARRVLGWQPTVNLDDGLAQTLRWFQASELSEKAK